MANYSIGDMIYETRTARGYSQEELGDGLCSPSSLSRIENGQQAPTKRLFDALMQRLGVSESIFSAFISREEMELYRLTQQLVWKIEQLDFQECKILTNELESKIQEGNIFERQYLLFAKAYIAHNEARDYETALELFVNAIHITIPDFDVKKGIRRRLLTFTEITIINGIALTLSSMDDEINALKLLFELKEYLEEHVIDEEEKAKKYPMIVYNITSILGQRGYHQEVYKLCSEAIMFATKHNKLIALPYLLTNKACAAAEMDKFAEAKKCFQQAYILFEVCENESAAYWIKTEASSKYGIVFEE